MVCGTCCSLLFKFAFLASGIFSVTGAIILWNLNVFNLQEDALARYNHDVLSFWVAWILCFFGYYFKQVACVVLTAGVILASLTYRQTIGNHGNLASIAGANMCRVFMHDNGNAINTAATWDPDFAARNTNASYSYSMDQNDAIYCVVGDIFLYLGLFVGLCCACSAGSDTREESPCWTRLVALAVVCPSYLIHTHRHSSTLGTQQALYYSTSTLSAHVTIILNEYQPFVRAQLCQLHKRVIRFPSVSTFFPNNVVIVVLQNDFLLSISYR
eukprot:m.203585 g.203585  ORF g.203585 m.203585 type:complete len:271 (-) comp18854_c1_seq3:979-1791(-)